MAVYKPPREIEELRMLNAAHIYWHVYHVRVQLIKVAAHTSCINFEKCYFSELTIYFAEDESGSLAMAKKRVSRAARRWNKTAAGKVEVEEQLFSKTPTTAFGCARTSFNHAFTCTYIFQVYNT